MISCPLPRADSHSWLRLRLRGADALAMMDKLCAVDLAPAVFAEGDVAQTIAARISTILIHADQDGEYALHMLSDSASSHYLRGAFV